MALTDIVMQPTLSADGTKLESVKVLKKTQSQKDTEAVRANSKSIEKHAGAIYTLNRSSEYKTFNKAILQIANKDYTLALTTLQAFAPKDKRIAEMLTSLDAVNHPENLRAINTYTYGAEKVKNIAKAVTKGEYHDARKGTIEAEKRLAPVRWNKTNEDFFKKENNHTPTQLSSFVELE